MCSQATGFVTVVFALHINFTFVNAAAINSGKFEKVQMTNILISSLSIVERNDVKKILYRHCDDSGDPVGPFLGHFSIHGPAVI